MRGSELAGLDADQWQAIGSLATAGAFVIAILAVVAAFLQLRHGRKAAELQLKQDRDTAAQQLKQNFELANKQIEASRVAADEQLNLAQRALSEQLDQAQEVQKLAALQLDQSRAAAYDQLEQDRQAMELQLKQAQEAALDASRPYVLVTVELSPVSISMLDLVLANVGSGPAFDVTLKVEPPLRRATETPGHELADARIFRAPVKMLPPHYRMRTWFESGPDRVANGADLPDNHDVTITYHDGRGHKWSETSVLDLTILDGLLFSEIYGVHHVAKTLKEIRDILRKAAPSPLAVTVEERGAYIARQRAEREERQLRHNALVERMRPNPVSEGESPTDSGQGL